jgi:predicted ATP-dependent protease
VEGFFEVCRARGLDGTHGVILPASNVSHLVLRDEPLAAIAEGRFRIWAIASVDDAIEVLSGLPAGAADGEGRFPPGTFNARVADRLERLAERARALAAPPREGDGGRRA